MGSERRPEVTLLRRKKKENLTKEQLSFQRLKDGRRRWRWSPRLELALGPTSQRLSNHDRACQLLIQLRILEALLDTGLQRESRDESAAISQHKLDSAQKMESL